MKISKTLLFGAAIITLTACQTTGGLESPTDILLSNINTPAASDAPITSMRSATHPDCATFYQNTASFIGLPLAAQPSFGDILLKTLVLVTLTRVSGGAVGAIGIESTFLESALIGTASHVGYNVGDTVYDKVVSPDPIDVDGSVLSPMVEIEKAAALIGCPAPDLASIERSRAEQLAAISN